MPQFDGTGPCGEGPMTGWGRGYCVVRLSNPKQELDYLRSQAQALEMQLSRIRDRIEKLKTTKEARHAGT